MIPLFVSGIGTDVGKTLVSAILVKALRAAYWKPVQAGYSDGTDFDSIRSLTGEQTVIQKESYRLRQAASPHIAAREEGVKIDLEKIRADFYKIEPATDYLVIEGAGGLLVPLNEESFVADLADTLNAPLILVSRNYLGSINHSLLTAEVCRIRNLKVAGWIFTDDYMNYDAEISEWTKLPVIARIPFLIKINSQVIEEQAQRIREPLLAALKLIA